MSAPAEPVRFRGACRTNHAEWHLTVAKTDSIKRGFVKHFVDFIAKKGKATVAELQAELTGRQFNGKKLTNDRVVRYAYWCVANGVLKVAAQARAVKAGAR
jgi:hypothetical protein